MAGVRLEPLLKTFNPHAKGYYTDANGRHGVKLGTIVVWVKTDEKFGYVEDGATKGPGDAPFQCFPCKSN